MRCLNFFWIRVALQDVFLSDTPLSLRPEKTHLQGETPRPDLSDRRFVKPAASVRANFALK